MLDNTSGEPIMEMYWLPPMAVKQLIFEHGGKLLKINKDHLTGKAWLSYTYFITK